MAETPTPMTSSPTGSEEDTDSDADNGPGKPQEPRGEQQPSTSTTQPGNVLPMSSSARDGPELANGRPVETVVMRRVRGPDGRLYNPEKMPERFAGEPESPRSARPNVGQAVPKSIEYNELQPRDTRIGGLSDIPKAWGELPSNASLGADISWVQSERLRVVIETPRGGIKVDLGKARQPAPSSSALSWLETSIRSYAKFVEVAAKQASSGQDEAEFIRKERMQVGEIRAILQEMMPASG